MQEGVEPAELGLHPGEVVVQSLLQDAGLRLEDPLLLARHLPGHGQCDDCGDGPMTATPTTITKAATTRPAVVTGTTSP